MGFCFVNNVICASLYAHSLYEIDRVAIIDFDLQNGNGTQELVMQLNEKQDKKKKFNIFYGSLHDILSYPTEIYDPIKVATASMCLMDHGQHIWNVHLEKYSNKAHFQRLLDNSTGRIVFHWAQSRELFDNNFSRI